MTSLAALFVFESGIYNDLFLRARGVALTAVRS